MKVELDLLNNSYDYLKESYRCFLIADEQGVHEEKYAIYNNKVKWKMAYITLVQAFELLVKEVLRSISPVLIYENIDIPINGRSKTVSGIKGLERLANCGNILVQDNKAFIKECIAKRNGYMHYDVQIDSATIKPTYCKLFAIYLQLHNDNLSEYKNAFLKLLNKEFPLYENVLSFAADFIVFRNQELRISDRDQFIEQIAINKTQGLFADVEGKEYKRIPYGSEVYFDIETSHEYCPDCAAAVGEFHYELCDIEVCPKCGGQKLSCGCFLEIVKI